MHKVLVIGCGNIGALYDFYSEKILTHAKAFFLSTKVELHLFDSDFDLSKKVASKYHAKLIMDIGEIDFSCYDIISICTPTPTHKFYLEKAILADVKLIICEKPITLNIEEINYLTALYSSSNSKVLVNYFRRFQPAYIDLKRQIKQILKDEQLTNVTVRTQRGFINNTSHSFDLIQFLFDKAIDLNNISIHNLVHDHFVSDPTLSLHAYWDKSNFILHGLSNVHFSFFEVDLFFEKTKISVINSGNDILTYKLDESNASFFKPLVLVESLSKTSCINDYMKSVIDYSFQLLGNTRSKNDNFIESINLNKIMLKIIQGYDGKTCN